MKILAGTKIYETFSSVAQIEHSWSSGYEFNAVIPETMETLEVTKEMIYGKQYRICTYDENGDVICEDLHIGVDKDTQKIIDMIVKADVNQKIEKYEEKAKVKFEESFQEKHNGWVRYLEGRSWKERLMYFLTGKIKYLNVKEN